MIPAARATEPAELAPERRATEPAELAPERRATEPAELAPELTATNPVGCAAVIRWRRAKVERIRREWPGALELEVVLEGAAARALAYPELVGRPEVGDEVLLNTTALSQGLGTGGYAFVVAIPDRLPPDPDGLSDRDHGHLVKARYTPLQTTVLGADEQASPHHDILRGADSLDGMPVVIADLHSALPAIVAGLREHRPLRVAYVMSDGGALPMWFSRTVAGLREAGWLAASVSVGQAFGGEHEAVNLHSGLLVARHVVGADVAVVTQGPGNLGTDTRWGFSGVASGEAVNAVAALRGLAVASLRISGADPRDRHRGVSHHSLTAYGRVALVAADVVVPALPEPLGSQVRREAAILGERHRLIEVGTDGLTELLRESPVPLSTMGRDLDADPAAFLSAAAAGRHAATRVRA